MTDVIKIKKGLTINLKGKAEKIFVKEETAKTFAVKPPDFHGLIPKLTVKVDDIVKAGSQLFYDKDHPEVIFTSPVSGKVVNIVRGERRRILEVVVEKDNQNAYEDFGKANPSDLSRAEIVTKLCKAGLWPMIRQRPYNIIANSKDTPISIFISCFDTNPLAPDYDFILKDLKEEFQTGIEAVRKLTDGTVHLNINAEYPASSTITSTKNVQINKFKGPHPAGNVGTQIHFINPINKGDLIWVLNPQDIVTIGRLFLKGIFDASRIIAFAGSEVLKPKYYKTLIGTSVLPIARENVKEGTKRFISGSILSGSRISSQGYLGYYDSSIIVVPEGNHHEFMGWLTPGLKKFSMSRSFFSWLTPNKEYTIDTNLKGGHRALMITGSFEKVFPLDIFPMQLIKSIIIEDIDLMEKLGIYEVAEEDFALCEFVDTSKTNIQEIVRNGLDLMIKEMN